MDAMALSCGHPLLPCW